MVHSVLKLVRVEPIDAVIDQLSATQYKSLYQLSANFQILVHVSSLERLRLALA